ncbi:MAG: hypothetical protein ACHQHO_04930 [Solirubrobacterales bacterium]
MDVLQADGSTIELELADAGIGTIVTELPLRCVWSGSVDGCSCRSRIKRDVVAQAWQRELDASADSEARFFHFISGGGVWMAYGMADGKVRGVYCPSHNSRRAERSRAALCSAGAIVLELPLAA